MTTRFALTALLRLDYALRSAIGPSDGLTLKKRGHGRRHPEEVLAELAYADNIALMENSIKETEDLRVVESIAQSIGLFLNAAKTKIGRLTQLQRAVYMLLMAQRLRRLKTSCI